jgi:hypothetical protein
MMQLIGFVLSKHQWWMGVVRLDSTNSVASPKQTEIANGTTFLKFALTSIFQIP